MPGKGLEGKNVWAERKAKREAEEQKQAEFDESNSGEESPQSDYQVAVTKRDEARDNYSQSRQASEAVKNDYRSSHEVVNKKREECLRFLDTIREATPEDGSSSTALTQIQKAGKRLEHRKDIIDGSLVYIARKIHNTEYGTGLIGYVPIVNWLYQSLFQPTRSDLYSDILSKLKVASIDEYPAADEVRVLKALQKKLTIMQGNNLIGDEQSITPAFIQELGKRVIKAEKRLEREPSEDSKATMN